MSRTHRLSAAVVLPVLALGLAVPAAAQRGSVPEAVTAPARTGGVDAKVGALLAKMTLQEKFGQLEMQGGDFVTGAATPAMLELARKGLLGTTLTVRGAANVNALQKAALSSRLHIPILFAFDVIHGYRTVFPVPLAEASSFDPAMARDNEAVGADEAAAAGVKWTFAPDVDLSHDARWGRIVEGSGEDPYLGAAMARAKVQGFQGNDISAPDRVAATVKHFAAYGAVEAGREYNTVDVSTERLHNLYLPPYKAGVEAGAATVMPSFNDINGVPSTGNRGLLTGLLRRDWSFHGVTVSDYTAVQELVAHGYAANLQDAAKLALTAGTDVEMVSTTYSAYGPALVKSGAVSTAQVDAAVRRVLRLKYLAGVFDHPYASPAREQAELLTPAHRAASRASAGESMVLLKNTGSALPLRKSTRSIALIGPLADNRADVVGPWSGDGLLHPEDAITVRAGISAAVPNATIHYAAGCDATCTSTSGFAAAVRAARAADVTVLAVGEPAGYSGEAASRSMLGLPGRQLALVQAVAATGKPYVVVLMNGRPLTIPWLAEKAPAILESWFPGTEAGNAVADVLFGTVNPSGKLPVSFPRDVGQVPIYYNARSTGRPADPANKYSSQYIDVPVTPQYPFGFGLSYTGFSISGLHTSAASIPVSGRLTVRATVRNTGKAAGTDVVQLYIHDRVASITQPVRRLRGFTRVTLQPGQSKQVQFTLDRKDLGFYDNDGRFRVEPGSFDVYVGDSSVGGLRGAFTLTR